MTDVALATGLGLFFAVVILFWWLANA